MGVFKAVSFEATNLQYIPNKYGQSQWVNNRHQHLIQS